jgi:D-amino peptidase
MKVFITCDMEGVAGVCDWDQADSSKPDYAHGRELMVGEVNAAIEGALAAGAKEVIVNDSHGSMTNLLPEKLNRAAKLLQGRVKPLSMMQGIDKSYDAALLIGYHSMADTQCGSLSHTYTGSIRRAEINGKVVGEPGLNAAFAGYFGVPVVFLSGDEAAVNEIRSLIPGIEAVAVKKAFGRKAILSIHPELAREMVRDGVSRALARRAEIAPLRFDAPFVLRIEVSDAAMGDICERIPSVKREGATTLQFSSATYLEAFKAFLTVMSLSQLAK